MHRKKQTRSIHQIANEYNEKNMKVLVIGCGSIGKRHIKNLIKIKGLSIYAFDVDKKKLKSVNMSMPSVYTSSLLHEFLNKHIDAAIVANPTSLHIRYATIAAKSGCHIFIEKPLSNTMRGIGDLENIINRMRLISYVGYNFRFDECLIKIKKLLNKQTLGKVIAARTHFGSNLADRHKGENYRMGYGAKKGLGGGVILDTLSHHVDYMTFLLGKPEEVFCYAKKISNLKINVEDTAEVLIRFAKGIIVNLHGNSIQRPYKHTIEIVGEKGTIICDIFKRTVKHYAKEKRKWVTYHAKHDTNFMYFTEIKDFIYCIKKRKLPFINIRYAREQLKILLYIKESNRKKQWIKI